MLWVDPPLDSHSTSALAHAVGGLLVGWAVAEFLRGRVDWPMWAIGAVGAVLALTIALGARRMGRRSRPRPPL